MRSWLFAVVVMHAGCSKKSEAPAGGGSGSAAAPAGSGSAAPTPATKPAPAMTPELFVTEPTKFTIEGLDRGLWISDRGGAFEHKCRVELGMAMGRAGKLRGAAMKSPKDVVCEAKGIYAVCSYALPEGDASSPDRKASWVFVTDDDSDEAVLIAVLFGAYDWAAIEPTIPPKQPCPRPSANP